MPSLGLGLSLWKNNPVLFNPYLLPNTAARYDSLNRSSLIVDGSNRTSLAGDLSGNSNVNVLALNGVAGNYASTPYSAAVGQTGDMQIEFGVTLSSIATASVGGLLETATTRSWGVRFANIGVNISFVYSTDGSTFTALEVAHGISALSTTHFKIEFDVDNGSGGKTATFYKSAVRGGPWTLLGSASSAVGTTSPLFTTADELTIGKAFTGITAAGVSGIIDYFKLQSGIGGPVVFNPDFSTFSKLAATGTESSANAATVTINSSGDTGARICGARDLVNLTVANQLVLQSGGGLLGNGTSQYAKTAAFALPQPMTVYFVGQQVSWTNTDYMLDGNTGDTMVMWQSATTPDVKLGSNVGSLSPLSTLLVGTTGILTGVWNGASSQFRHNRNSAVTGNPGTAAANGLTLGARGAAPLNNSNILVLELIVRSVADSASLQDRIINYLIRKHRIAA